MLDDILHRRKPLYLSKWHNVMLDVRPGHWLWVFIIICNHYSDSGIKLANTGDEIFEFVIAQKGLGSDGNKSANVVLWVGKEKKNMFK